MAEQPVRAHGGKLVITTAGADQAIPPFGTLNYYRVVARRLGGYPATQSFSLLYMIPGLYHCPCGQPVDGDPATIVELVTPLVNWVEHGRHREPSRCPSPRRPPVPGDFAHGDRSGGPLPVFR